MNDDTPPVEEPQADSTEATADAQAQAEDKGWEDLTVEEKLDVMVAAVAQAGARPAPKRIMLPPGLSFSVNHFDAGGKPGMLLTFTDEVRAEQWVIQFMGGEAIDAFNAETKRPIVDVAQPAELAALAAKRQRDQGAAARGRRR